MMDDKENNVIKLRAGHDIIFNNLICECGGEEFYISVRLKAVCTQCLHWMDGYINLQKERQ